MPKIIFLLLSLLIGTSSIANDLVMKVIPLNYRQAEEVQAILAPLLENSERVIANRSTLIIKATPARQEELKTLITQLDRRLTNLLITVIQSNTKTAHALNYSIKNRIHLQGGNTGGVSIKTQGHFGNTENLNDSESRQQIQTLDGKIAYIKTGEVHPINNISIHQSEYGHPIVSSNTQFIEATTGFLVTPRLSRDQVTLEISPWSDKIKNNGTLSTQSGHTTIRTTLGQWVEIGGVSEQSQQSTNKILSHHYSTGNKSMKIFIKVDKSQ